MVRRWSDLEKSVGFQYWCAKTAHAKAMRFAPFKALPLINIWEQVYGVTFHKDIVKERQMRDSHGSPALRGDSSEDEGELLAEKLRLASGEVRRVSREEARPVSKPQSDRAVFDEEEQKSTVTSFKPTLRDVEAEGRVSSITADTDEPVKRRRGDSQSLNELRRQPR